jgi:flagellin-like hook-associated protein FlgL
MLSPSAPIFGNLATATSRALAGLERSAGRALGGHASAQALADGDGGKHTFATRLSSSSRIKQIELQNVQGAVTYLELQDSGLQVVGRIFDRMGVVAGKAEDRTLSMSGRASLVKEFEALQQSLFDLQGTSFQGHYLFQESVDFSSGLNEQNTSPVLPDTYESNVTSTDQRHGNGNNVKRWTATKDVRYDRGKVTLKVNSGTAEERYFLLQGSSNVIFDTGWWETAGSAYTDDFDQFVVEYSPGKNTTYQFSSLDSDLDGNDDNSPYNKNDSGNYVENRWGDPIITNPAIAGETDLSVVIESKTLFQANAVYETVLSNDILEIPAGEGMVTISPGLFSTLYDASVDTAENAANAIVLIIDEIESLGQARGQLGVGMNELQYSADRLAQTVYAETKSLSRMESDFAEAMLHNAKERLRLESTVSLAAQAKELNRNLLQRLF